MPERFTELVYRGRLWIWLCIAAVAGTLSLITPPITFDQTVEAFFPPQHPALLSYQRSKAAFGGDHLVFVAWDDPELWTDAGMTRVRAMADAIAEQVPGIARIDALDRMPIPWKVDDAVVALTEHTSVLQRLGRLLAGRATVHMLIRSVAADAEKMRDVRQRLCAHPLYRGFVVDEAGRSTALLVRLQDPDQIDQQQTIAALRQAADSTAVRLGIAQVAVAGPPVLVVDGFVSLDKDNHRLGAVAMAVMAVTMLAAVRNPAWAVLPLLAGWATWQVVQATIAWFNLQLTLSSGPIIATTIVLCMPAASHLAVRFRAARRAGTPRDTAALTTLRAVLVPVAWCSATAAAGYLATALATSVQPVFQQGITMCICNLAAGALTWLLAAAAMCPGRRTAHSLPAATATQPSPQRTSGVSQRVGWLTDRILAHPGRWLLLFVVAALVTTLGALSLQFESNYINIYKPHARVARDYRFIEDRMGGIGLVELVFPGPATVDPAWLDHLQQTTQSLTAADPELMSGVASLADLLSLPRTAAVSTAAGTADAAAAGSTAVAATPEARAEFLNIKLRVLTGRTYADVLSNFWNREQNVMRILCRVRESAPAERKEACFQSLLQLTRAAVSPDSFITGLSHLMTQITHAVILTAFQSTAWAVGIICLMSGIALRSLRLALLSLTPTLLAVGLVLGVMGWLGMKIDMSTALVASVAMGLSVDDTFHCLLRWQSELASGTTHAAALRAAYAGSGPGVLLSSAAVSIGFLVMLFSEFVPTANFGWLVSVATLGGSLGNLIVLPALLALFGPSPHPTQASQHHP